MCILYQQKGIIAISDFSLFLVANVTPPSVTVKGFASPAPEKSCARRLVRFFRPVPLTVLRVPLGGRQGKEKKNVHPCGVLPCMLPPCGMCIYSKKCPCRTILAFLALLKRILRLPLWHGTKTERKDYIPMYRT